MHMKHSIEHTVKSSIDIFSVFSDRVPEFMKKGYFKCFNSLEVTEKYYLGDSLYTVAFVEVKDFLPKFLALITPKSIKEILGKYKDTSEWNMKTRQCNFTYQPSKPIYTLKGCATFLQVDSTTTTVSVDFDLEVHYETVLKSRIEKSILEIVAKRYTDILDEFKDDI